MQAKRTFPHPVKQTILLAIGLILMALGVALSIKADLGTSPISSLPYVTSLMSSLSVGTTTIIMNGLFVVIQIIILRRRYDPFQLLQFPAAILFGSMIDLWGQVLAGLPPTGYFVQLLLCVLGIVLVAVGVSIEVAAKLVTTAGEGVVLAVCQVAPVRFGSMKTAFDVTLVCLSVILSTVFLHGLYGVREGTVLAAIFVGQITRVTNPIAQKAASWLMKESYAPKGATHEAGTPLPLFAQGGEADLYQLDSHRLLRVPRSGHVDFSVETTLFPQLAAHHIPIPTFYGVTTYHGRPAQIIEQIDGPSALSELMRHPLHLAGFMRSFSALHEKILSIPGPANLPSLREQLYTLQAQPERLPKKDLLSILRLLDTLPQGHTVCHGDFHPGNLLTCRGKTYVIDWGAAHTGCPLSDVAHTFLLLSLVPRTPGQHWFAWRRLQALGWCMAKCYRHYMKKRLGFSRQDFRSWCAVMALYRLYHGLPSEQKSRKKAVEKACTRPWWS